MFDILYHELVIHRRYATLSEIFEVMQERCDALHRLYGQPLRPYLFVGSGIEYGVHSSWEKFVDNILESCDLPLKISTAETQPERAERAKSQNEDSYKKAVLKEYTNWEPVNQLVMEEIGQLDVEGVVTTNYGSALKNRFASRNFQPSFPGKILGDSLAHSPQSVRRVYYIHGHIQENQSAEDELDIVLASSEYKKSYQNPSELQIFLSTLFGRESVIFIGLGLTRDDPFPEILTTLAQAGRSDTKIRTLADQRLFAFMALPVRFQENEFRLNLNEINEKEIEFGRMGVTPVWFDPSNNFKHLKEMVKSLSNSYKKAQSVSDIGGEPRLKP